MWRISEHDLRGLGWIIYGDETELHLPLEDRAFTDYDLHREGLHINLLELIALIINVWCTIKRIQSTPISA
jgi:hypothetical protein